MTLITRLLLLASAIVIIPGPPAKDTPRRVTVNLLGCIDCATNPPRVGVWDEGTDLPLDPVVVKRTPAGFIVLLRPSYYSLSVNTDRCSGDPFTGVLPGRDRTVSIRMNCGKRFVRMVDAMRGLAGSFPGPVRAVRMWPALGDAPPVSAMLSREAYYFDEANCRDCVLELELKNGEKSRIAVSLESSPNFSLSRRDLTQEDVSAGLAIRGSPFNAPETLVEGPQQSIWVLDRLGNRVAAIVPGRGPREYELPTPFSDPAEIIATRDYVWVSERNVGKIVRLGLDGRHAEYAIGGVSYYADLRIAPGPDGRLWYINNGQLGAIDEDGVVTKYTAPQPVAWLHAVAAGADGRLWITGDASAQGFQQPFIAARNSDGTWQRTAISGSAFELRATARGFWVATGENWSGYLGFVRLNGGETRAKLPLSRMGPKIYAVAGDDAFFSDYHGDVIAHASPDGSVEATYADTVPTGISDMAIDKQDHLWVAQPSEHLVAEYKADGTAFDPLSIAFPPRGVSPKFLLSASTGELWYSDPVADVVGTIGEKGVRCYAFRLARIRSCRFSSAYTVSWVEPPYAQH